MSGYIYLRTSIYYDQHNVFKFGQTKNIHNREGTYVTSEVKRGSFIKIIEILSNHNIEDVENSVMRCWHCKYNLYRYIDGGTEFFDKLCINYLDEALHTIVDIKYRYLDEAEIERINTQINDQAISYHNQFMKNINHIITPIAPTFEFRFGQQIAFERFQHALTTSSYCGIMIAPTGWGKSLMHILFMAAFFNKYPRKACILVTKNKDILTDFIYNCNKTILWLQSNGIFPSGIFKIHNIVSNTNIPELDKYAFNIYICNIDKIRSKYTKVDNEHHALVINDRLQQLLSRQVDLLIFDEIHWGGSKCTYHMMEHIKKHVSYILGSSATPLRIMIDNRDNTFKLFSSKTSASTVNPNDSTYTDDDLTIKFGLNILYSI